MMRNPAVFVEPESTMIAVSSFPRRSVVATRRAPMNASRFMRTHLHKQLREKGPLIRACIKRDRSGPYNYKSTKAREQQDKTPYSSTLRTA
jgi:hypothetical protein